LFLFPLAGEQLASSLSEALSSGNSEEALKLCQKLSQLCLPVCVTINSQVYPQENISTFTQIFFVDQAIPPQVSQDYGFSSLLQRWVIGKRLAKDKDTLFNHGICQNGDQAFLFILSAQATRLTRHQHKLEQEQHRGLGAGTVEKTQPDPALSSPKPRVNPKPPVIPNPKLGWTCTRCTFLNKPTRPGCEICGGDRPEGYKVPEIYKPDQEVIVLAQREERELNYLHLLATEDQNLILSTTQTDCPVCFSTLEPGEGIVLRECLHTFCRECLHDTIVNSQDAEVSCPDACDSKLLDREIKELLTPEELQRFLDLRLGIAESRAEHSFHCQTPNCRGWCVYEDEVNEFLCQICNETNCILCRAIHNGMNCKDYQDDLRIRAQNDQAAQQTKQMLEALLQNGEAMKCPRCDIIVQKKDGCDWICCLMCKTEICWVTKQARWGPNGTGDTSGGCRCRVDNQRCHPNCQNCH
uniref:RanBP-type and C3HC4-type zinc finger-containing protein 1 n=1 Tax=Cynoglossus semilaevis TaxID=244447 RepID=A0A3P8WYT8_CYNSE